MSKLSADDRKTSAHLESLKSRLVNCLNSEKLDAEWRAKSADLVEETLFVGHARVDSTSGGEFYPQTGGGRIGKVEQIPEEKNKSQCQKNQLFSYRGAFLRTEFSSSSDSVSSTLSIQEWKC